MPLMVAMEPTQPMIPKYRTLISATAIGPRISPSASDRFAEDRILGPNTNWIRATAKVNIRRTIPIPRSMYAIDSGFSIFIRDHLLILRLSFHGCRIKNIQVHSFLRELRFGKS